MNAFDFINKHPIKFNNDFIKLEKRGNKTIAVLNNVVIDKLSGLFNRHSIGAIVKPTNKFTRCQDGTFSTAKKVPCRTRGGVHSVQKSFF